MGVEGPAADRHSYDPDEVEVPALQIVMSTGVPARPDELEWMVGLLDPAMLQAAHGADRWTPRDRLNHLLDRRRAGGK